MGKNEISGGPAVPKETQKQLDQRQLGGIMVKYPSAYMLIEEKATILHNRSIEERTREGGTSIRIKFDEVEDAHKQFCSIVSNIQMLNLIEKVLDIRLALRGEIVIALSCEAAGCQCKNCLLRK